MITISIVVVCAALLIMGAPWWVCAAGVVLAHSPSAGLVAVAGGLAYQLVVHRRHPRRATTQPAKLLRSIADDLAVGRTLHEVVVSWDGPDIDRDARRLAAVGASGEEIAAAVAPRLRRHGPGFRSAVALSEVTGGSLTQALHVLADQAELDAASARERRVATSQARFTAVVVGAVPLIVAIGVIATRGLPEPGGPLVVIPMILGAGLMLVGSGIVAWMSRSVAPR